MTYRPILLPPIRSEALLESARGMPCTLRLHRECNDWSVVACHLPGLPGSPRRATSDLHVCYGCGPCHDLIDKRRRDGEWSHEDLLRALCETHMLMKQHGLIEIKEGK